VSLFKASFDVGLEQTLQGKRLAILREFVSWLQQLAQQAERDPLSAVESLIAGLHYDSWLYETAPSAKAAEMRLKNVELLYKWLTDMIKGDELNEPVSLAQAVSRFTLRDMLDNDEQDADSEQVQ